MACDLSGTKSLLEPVMIYWPLEDGVVTYFSNFQVISKRYIGHSLWTCPQVNTAKPHWWLVNIGSGRQQAITWANVNPNLCCHMASLGHNELTILGCCPNVLFCYHLSDWQYFTFRGSRGVSDNLRGALSIARVCGRDKPCASQIFAEPLRDAFHYISWSLGG